MVQAPIKTSIPQTQATKAEKRVSKLEGIKERSNFLREPVATEI